MVDPYIYIHKNLYRCMYHVCMYQASLRWYRWSVDVCVCETEIVCVVPHLGMSYVDGKGAAGRGWCRCQCELSVGLFWL